MQKIHQLGHAFEALRDMLVGGSVAGYLATDSLPPKAAGYLTLIGLGFGLIGKFMTVYAGEHFHGEPPTQPTPKP